MRAILPLLAGLLLSPQLSHAMNKDGGFGNRETTDHVSYFEQEGSLDRDALGRKIVVSPNANIDFDSLYVDMAPWSTVILNVQQHDKGTQTTISPYYRNIEIPK